VIIGSTARMAWRWSGASVIAPHSPRSEVRMLALADLARFE
jgi:hypothetical protein